MMVHIERLRRQGLLVPRPLQAGDTIGVVAVSGPADHSLLTKGVEWLASRGFRVITGPNVSNCAGYLAGTDVERAADLNVMFADPEVRGIFVARGGYGCMRILESLESENVGRDPKILVGMSDITALQLFLYSECGLVTFSGPMVAGQIAKGLDHVSSESMMDTVTKPLIDRELVPGSVVESIRILRPGSSSGVLLGGCLSLLTALLGTPYCPDFTGAVLFLEEVNEAPYRVDRMLTQLKLAGVLDKLNGIVIGHFLGPKGENIMPAAEEMLLEKTHGTSCPIIAGLPHGHRLPNLTLPHGVLVEMDTDNRSLRVETNAAPVN